MKYISQLNSCFIDSFFFTWQLLYIVWKLCKNAWLNYLNYHAYNSQTSQKEIIMPSRFCNDNRIKQDLGKMWKIGIDIFEKAKCSRGCFFFHTYATNIFSEGNISVYRKHSWEYYLSPWKIISIFSSL